MIIISCGHAQGMQEAEKTADTATVLQKMHAVAFKHRAIPKYVSGSLIAGPMRLP